MCIIWTSGFRGGDIFQLMVLFSAGFKKMLTVIADRDLIVYRSSVSLLFLFLLFFERSSRKLLVVLGHFDTIRFYYAFMVTWVNLLKPRCILYNVNLTNEIFRGQFLS